MTSIWWTASQQHVFSFFLLVFSGSNQKFVRLIYPERSFIEKNTMTSVPSRCLCDVCRCLWSLELCVGCPLWIRKMLTHAFKRSMTFDIATQVLSVYTTFPRFLFPREDHRGKELRRVRSPVEAPGANAERTGGTPPGSAGPPPVAVGAPRCWCHFWEIMVTHTGSTVSRWVGIFPSYFGTIQQHHSTHFCGVSFT